MIGSSYILNTIQADSMLRETSETGFLQPALKRSNLVVYTESLATRILFNGKTAAGIRVDTGGKEYVLSATKEVILSAGAFQSPQLLMVSGIGPAPTLEKFGIPLVADRAGVGQNMWVRIPLVDSNSRECADSCRITSSLGPVIE
jgi:choline dehydrogenase